MNPELQTVYADMHIHIGRSESGRAIKISGSRNLTFANIAHEASERKGIGLIGIIDCHSPAVQADIRQALLSGEMTEVAGGGIGYRNTVIMLGTELEVRQEGMREAHVLAYFPDMPSITDFTLWISQYMKNVELSSQRVHIQPRELQAEVYARGGILIPAHVFTPHKGIYGSSAPRMADMLDLNMIDGVELGLSADSGMAGLISELDPYTFLTNSDAHSLGKIGREYNELQMAAGSFEEFVKVLRRQEGRRVAANYGLNPRLGKYHRTFCSACGAVMDEEHLSVKTCPQCGSHKLVQGVLDRILHIADRSEPLLPAYRPPYRYQVPLEFIPGLGKASMEKLLTAFGTEMNILHRSGESELEQVVGQQLARYIVSAREGTLLLSSGGGGIYGKVMK
ncbi:endonuclease Q family protein [Paenibacillus sp. JX-17]|uniref:Endonuclease Q family protein n=1 Tax=Paenibacillus lacisoli TaxID=3064525 RepID=A0ABT9C790_9BACL|nr:endonuclease Q family protein [Paenibacillus sp. JX-17]MDO7905137.1 endonuclease Q family protein [Paenibacillus sp. JX-17]